MAPSTDSKRTPAQDEVKDHPVVSTTDDNSTKPDPPIEKDNREYISGYRLWLLVTGLLLTVFIMMLDTSILSTAIPYVTNAFDTIDDIGWYGAGYLVATSSLQPLSGRIYTYFPLKYSYLTFLAIFAFGSLLCGTAVSSTMLILGRAVSGIGGSGLANGAMTIIGIEGSPERRPMLFALIFSATGIGQLLGPLIGAFSPSLCPHSSHIIGGPLTQYVSWRW
jgi:MFS family permease